MEIRPAASPTPPDGELSLGAFEQLADQVRAGIETVMPVDAVLLSLSGRMAVEGVEDADGLLLAEVRSSLQPGMRLAACFEPEADLSPLMVRACDLLTGSAEAAVRILAAAHREEVHPVMAISKPPLWVTDPRRPALEELNELARHWENEPGVLHVGLGLGSGELDEPRMGMGILVVTDGDMELAAEVAEHMAEEAWDRRESLAAATPPERHLTHIRRPLHPLDRTAFEGSRGTPDGS